MMYGKLCTEFYDLDKRFADADEISFYQPCLDQADVILEPMCGSGRLLIPLLQQGYSIHGVDNSVSMLESCKQRARARGLDPVLYHDSIETMDLPCRYNVILIPLGSFQLLYPRSAAYQALSNFNRHLLEGGKLILDLFVPWDALSKRNENEFNTKEVLTPDGGKIVYQSHDQINIYDQNIYSEAVYKKIINDQIVADEYEQMHISWYYRYEMELMLEKFGFRHISFQEKIFRDENHMLFIAEK
jgi:SAM-dependent methyltransferase